MQETEKVDDKISARIRAMRERVEALKERDLYFYNQPIDELVGGIRVRIRGREMLMFASYGYLGLLGHPRINAAAKAAIDEYGTGTHGVRLLAGTLKLHGELEETIAHFKSTDSAVTFSSGYVTNFTAISTMVGRHDVVICDKLNHASILDGCLLSGADLVRFRHNDMFDLERCLQKADPDAGQAGGGRCGLQHGWRHRQPAADRRAVQEIWRLADGRRSPFDRRAGQNRSRHRGAFWPGQCHRPEDGDAQQDDPVGWRLPGRRQRPDRYVPACLARLYFFGRHAARPGRGRQGCLRGHFGRAGAGGYSAPQCRALYPGPKHMGFDTMRTETAIVPVLCGPDDRAFTMVSYCQHDNIFVSAGCVAGSARRVRPGCAPLSLPPTPIDDIDTALAVFEKAGKRTGII